MFHDSNMSPGYTGNPTCRTSIITHSQPTILVWSVQSKRVSLFHTNCIFVTCIPTPSRRPTSINLAAPDGYGNNNMQIITNLYSLADVPTISILLLGDRLPRTKDITLQL